MAIRVWNRNLNGAFQRKRTNYYEKTVLKTKTSYTQHGNKLNSSNEDGGQIFCLFALHKSFSCARVQYNRDDKGQIIRQKV